MTSSLFADFDLSALANLPTQEFGLIISVAIFGAILVTWRLARQSDTGYAMRLAIGALVLFSLLRLYSASSFIWGSHATPVGLGLTRMVVLAVLTVILILIAVLTVYWVRVARRP